MQHKAKPKPEARDYTGCETCAYYSKGFNGQNPLCNYLAHTGKPRGCPAGAGCTRYATEREMKQPSLEMRCPEILTVLERQARHREAERAARHFEQMTRRPIKQKIAAGAGTPTTIEKEKLLQSDDTIISGKSQVRPIYEKEF